MHRYGLGLAGVGADSPTASAWRRAVSAAWFSSSVLPEPGPPLIRIAAPVPAADVADGP